MKDQVYAQQISHVTDFVFSEQVAHAFDDMTQRSIPFYDEVQRMCAQLCHYFYQENSSIIDLGSSTGALAEHLLDTFNADPFKYIGIDNSDSMINQAQQKFESKYNSQVHKNMHDVQFLHADILDTPLTGASVVIANYTMHFIRPITRHSLLRSIFKALPAGGAFIMSEKVLESDSANSRLFNRLYFNFKKQKGYSELEIAQKREALENVLIPYRIDENKHMLHEAGFEHVDIFFKWYNFASFLATKKS